MAAVWLTQLLVNPFGYLHLLEPLDNHWKIIHPLRTDFHPVTTHTLQSQKLLSNLPRNSS